MRVDVFRNPVNVGYLSGYAAWTLVEGTITGKVGDTFDAVRLGEKEVIPDGDGTQVMLSDPYRFSPDFSQDIA